MQDFAQNVFTPIDRIGVKRQRQFERAADALGGWRRPRAARAYACALVADVTGSYRPDVIELESPCFMGFAHEFHHAKDGVGLTAEDDFLLSLCFCPACLARAGRAGVDGERARATVRRWIVVTCEREFPAPRWPVSTRR
jgi:hypothetical protein